MTQARTLAPLSTCFDSLIMFVLYIVTPLIIISRYVTSLYNADRNCGYFARLYILLTVLFVQDFECRTFNHVLL